MTRMIEPLAADVRQITDDDLQRFSAAVEIRDADAFAAELQAFVRECAQALQPPASPDASAVAQTLADKAAALRAGRPWAPGATDIQRGRAALLETFDQPHNLPLPEFARLAHKSRQQIYKDIDKRRLLALNAGPRGQKLPDWQLDPVKQHLTQAVLQRAGGIDDWTLYRAFAQPLEGLGGLAPVDAVAPDSIDEVARAVFNVLGVH